MSDQIGTRVANVITFPARTVGQATSAAATGVYGTARRWFADEVDDWGRDDSFTRRFWTIGKARWDVSVGGADYLPRRAGALVVVNSRRLALAPLFAALALSETTGRPVRFVCRPDVAPLGPALQRLGALLPIPAEIHGALRAGEVVVLGARHTSGNERCGVVDHGLVGAAVAAKVPVFPAATASTPIRRGARVEVGQRVVSTRRRRGPLDELETADHVRARIDALLEEMGGTLTGTPLDWLPIDLLSLELRRNVTVLAGAR